MFETGELSWKKQCPHCKQPYTQQILGWDALVQEWWRLVKYPSLCECGAKKQVSLHYVEGPTSFENDVDGLSEVRLISRIVTEFFLSTASPSRTHPITEDFRDEARPSMAVDGSIDLEDDEGVLPMSQNAWSFALHHCSSIFADLTMLIDKPELNCEERHGRHADVVTIIQGLTIICTILQRTSSLILMPTGNEQENLE